MTETTGTRPMDGYIDAALEALGSEDSEFYLTAQDAAAAGLPCATVILSCRYQGCEWGIFVGEMELWEFVADARQHWEGEHAQARTSDTTGDET